jgi:hypothetical protein
MPTNRTPRQPAQRIPVTERAIRLFMRMRRYEERDERWWDLHNELFDEVHAKPWNWPCVQPPDACADDFAPPGTRNHRTWKPNLAAQALWRALEDGARELRRRDRAARAQQRANGGTTAPTAEAPPFAAAPHSGE